MTAALSWTTGEQSGCAIVTVQGKLDLGTAHRLQGALQNSLAEQPAALLADLSQMSLGDEVALSVFAAVHRQAGIWPGTPVLLCGPRPEVAGLLARNRYGSLQVRAGVDEAVSEVSRTETVMPMISDQLLPLSGAARHARDVATAACAQWHLPDLVGPASVVVTELVTNAVEHANTMITLQLVSRPRYLHVAVRDGSAHPPQARLPVEGELDRGRGLLLVDSLAVDWGWLPTRDGKVVWATLAI
ncbi:ATP-binding protein [Actinoplanes sp. NPDC020271]|uniref:ATP-binding protein n=1 Tax=Actinoplanes sp. NPDC020271 TaxID=3363896 RepID=UPI0037A732C8